MPSHWTYEKVARGLENFLACSDEWPPAADFRAAGRKHLYDAACAHGGCAYWAAQLGVAYRGAPGRRGYDDRRICTELRAVLRVLVPVAVWPTAATFARLGSPALVAAMQATGGAQRWADELGIPLRGSQRRWSAETIERELRAFIGARDCWPTRQEFEQRGRAGLLRAVYAREGTSVWATRLGVRAPGRRRRRTASSRAGFAGAHGSAPSRASGLTAAACA